jgi:hypothetical protein
MTLLGQFIAGEPAIDGGTGTNITSQPPMVETVLATPLHH